MPNNITEVPKYCVEKNLESWNDCSDLQKLLQNKQTTTLKAKVKDESRRSRHLNIITTPGN